MRGTNEILVVDDDLQVRKGLRGMLQSEGFAVRLARDGGDAIAAIADRRPDLVLLDVMMPKMNGYSVCAEIRRLDPALPVVFLTAKDEAADEVRGLDIGADDYVAKSAPDSVLLARIRRALARNADAPVAGERLPTTATIGGVRVDFVRFTYGGDGVEGRFTRDEAMFLRCLASDRGRSFSYAEISAALYGRDAMGDVHLMNVHAHNIKNKLGRAGEMLRNDRGVGYRLMA